MMFAVPLNVPLIGSVPVTGIPVRFGLPPGAAFAAGAIVIPQMIAVTAARVVANPSLSCIGPSFEASPWRGGLVVRRTERTLRLPVDSRVKHENRKAVVGAQLGADRLFLAGQQAPEGAPPT